MQVAIGDVPLRQWGLIFTAFFLLVVYALTVQNGLEALAQRHGWMIGDWLINYQGGFVRRGLLGEAAYRLAHWLGVNPAHIVLGIALACYALFFGFSFLLLKGTKNLLPYAFLVFSPFIFLFQIHDFAGGFRKEIIFIALLAFAVWLAKSTVRFERWFFAILWLYPALVLSHEASIIWLPLLLIVYFFKTKPSQRQWLWLLAAIVPSSLAFGLALWFKGDDQTVANILFSLREAGYMNFKAAIAALNDTSAQGRALTTQFMQNGKYLIYYPQAVLLALLAFIPLRNRVSASASPINLALLFSALLGSAVLMVVAADWGRFIYVLLVSLFLLSFLPDDEASAKPITPMQLVWLGALAFAYTILWYLPHSGNANPYTWSGLMP